MKAAMTASEQEDGRAFREPRRLAVWSGAAALMVLPVLALRGFNDPASDPGDFIFLAILLAGVALAYEVGARITGRRAFSRRAALPPFRRAAFGRCGQ